MISTQDSKKTRSNLKEGEDLLFSPSSYEKESTVDKHDLWRKIYECLQVIINSEFTDPAKRTLTPHGDRVQFACVYCGDSHKDVSKKRGNLFPDTMQYHCFNGDCGAHMSILNFMKDRHMDHHFTPAEKAFLRYTSKSSSVNLKTIKSNLGLETYFSDEIDQISIEREFLMDKLKLQEIPGSKIQKYLIGRMQTDYIKFAYDPTNRNIHIFNLTKNDRIIGMQIKTFKKKNPYLTYKVSKLHHELLGLNTDHELLSKMDYLSNIFNIFKIDIHRPVTVFEGPLDSFLFPNSVALCSAKNSLPFDIDGSRYFYDNDETGREYSVRRLSEGKSTFLWKKYLDENELSSVSYKIKDLNDLVMYMRDNKRSYKRFVDYFSDDKYDMVFV